MSKRFIVGLDEITIENDHINITGKSLKHINILRYKKNDKIEINKYIVEILKISKEVLYGKILEKVNKRGEPTININLYQGYLKFDKMETVVEKAVELGVKKIIPILTKNTVVKLDDNDKIKKVQRLNKIVIESIEQCGRTDAVIVENVKKIKDILKDLKQNDINILAYEKSKKSLKDLINKQKKEFNQINKRICNIAVIIGPEGGFDEEEIQYLMSNLDNIYDVSLGERILRSETASANILSILGYDF